MTTVSSNVEVASVLSANTLAALMNREIGAIHVADFYPTDIAEQIAEMAVHHPAMGHYHKKHTSSVGRVYTPFIDTRRDPELTARYHDEAVASIHQVRSMYRPHISPVDHIRLLLQELWPAGANLLRLHGRTCFVGAFRVFNPVTSEFYPHNDLITQETDAPEVQGVTEQLVANTYLQVADEGGTLQLWLREPTDEERDIILDVEGLDPRTIEPPALTFDPLPGDLIMFSSAMLHAVTPTTGKHRVAMATFIGCKGPDEPLFFWS